MGTSSCDFVCFAVFKTGTGQREQTGTNRPAREQCRPARTMQCVGFFGEGALLGSDTIYIYIYIYIYIEPRPLHRWRVKRCSYACHEARVLSLLLSQPLGRHSTTTGRCDPSEETQLREKSQGHVTPDPVPRSGVFCPPGLVCMKNVPRVFLVSANDFVWALKLHSLRGHLCIYIYIYIYVYLCMYIYIYIYTHLY